MLSDERDFLLLNAGYVSQRIVQYNNRGPFHPNKPSPQGVLINDGQLHNMHDHCPIIYNCRFPKVDYYRHALFKTAPSEPISTVHCRPPTYARSPVITGLPQVSTYSALHLTPAVWPGCGDGALLFVRSGE